MHMPPPVHGAAMIGSYIYDSELIRDAFDCRFVNMATAESLEDIGGFSLKKLAVIARKLSEIVRAARDFRPDLIYVTPNASGPSFYKDFLCVQLLRRYSRKVVLHLHNKGVSDNQDSFIDDRLYRRLFSGLKVILISRKLYPDVSRYVAEKDVFYCPNAIRPTLETHPEHLREDGRIHLLFLSNLIVSKGVVVLLDALKELKDMGMDFVCDFVGGETAEIDKAGFESMVAVRGLDGYAVYHGRRYGDEKAEFFRKADIFVFPTYYKKETFGLVNLEAMEYGLPVISSDEGGVGDVVIDGKTGFLLPHHEGKIPVDHHEIAEAIHTLAEDPDLRRRMGEAGRELFRDKYILPIFERRIMEILNEAVTSE